MNLTKLDILDILDYFNLPTEEFIILSGASMVLQNIKETTTDIDIAVSSNLEKELLNNFNCDLEKVLEDGIKVWFIDNILNFSTNFYKDTPYITFKNYKLQTTNSILLYKKLNNRPKDLKDIILLERKI